MAKISYLISKASSLWKYFEDQDATKKDAPEDGQIVFSKNNVCVHYPSSSVFQIDADTSADIEQHFPGYLVLRSHRCCDEESEQHTTLILSWIPNMVLKKNPKSVEHSPCRSVGLRSATPSPGRVNLSCSRRTSRRHSLQSINSTIYIQDTDAIQVSPEDVSAALSEMISSREDENGSSQRLMSGNKSTPHISVSRGSSAHSDPENEGTNKSGCDKQNSDHNSNSSHHSWSPCHTPTTPAPTPTSPQDSFGRQFLYENSSPVGIFTVNLKDMKSLRLFFSSQTNEGCNGQLVIASRESQYKVFHFHHGGLDKLVSILEEWDFLKLRKSSKNKGSNYKQFSVCKPQLRDDG